MVGSPWKKGPGILRRPNDSTEIATTHYTNKLLWYTFHSWLVHVLMVRLKRLKDELVTMIYEKGLKRRAFRVLQNNARANREVKRFCTDVKQMKLTKLKAILEHSSNDKHLTKDTLQLIYVVRFNQAKLLRKYFNIWRNQAH